jgi:cell division protein FtsL
MISPLLDIVFQYGAAVVTGLAVGLVCKVIVARQMQTKIRGYQGEIVKSHSRILSLEAQNDRLDKKIKELEGKFSKEHLFMN